MARRSLIAIALLLFVAAGCGPIVPSPTGSVPGSPLTPKGPLMAEFDANLAKWQSAGITRYAFTYQPFCFCPLAEHLVLGDGEDVRIDGVSVTEVAAPEGAPIGVDGLFAIVRRAIQGDRATITYDSATGVPLTLDSDPIAEAIDDELTFKVVGWTLDPPDDHVLGRITTARRDWDASGILTYAWSFVVHCNCREDGRRFDVTVSDGEISSVRNAGRKIAFDPIDPAQPYTVPRLFDILGFAAIAPQTTVAMTLDPEHGYPARASIDDTRPDDPQRWSYRVVSFRVGG